MRIFIAGATGTMGRPTTAALAQEGHEVVAMTRDASRARGLAEHVRAVEVADAFDGAAVRRALDRHRPDALLHLLTDLPREGPRRLAHLARTNRLRTEATRVLLDAAAASGVRRVVAESFFLAYGVGDFGERELAEEELPPPPTGGIGRAVAAIRSLEEQVLTFGRAPGRTGVALRFGMLVGAGVPSHDAMREGLAASRIPVIGDGRARVPVVHLADAVDAVVAALEAPTGAYNVADDRHPEIGALLRTWAAKVGARPPRSVPYWLARLVAPFGARFMTTSIKMDARKAREAMGWAARRELG